MKVLALSLALSFTLLNGCSDEGGARLSVGNQAPDFSITTIDGSTLSLSALRGRSLLITSAATWCGTCVIEARELRKAYRELQGKSVAFLTVSIDTQEDAQVLKQFRAREQTPWFYATAEGAADLISTYSLDRFEVTYIIDSSGTIRYRDEHITTAEETRAALTPLLLL